MKQCMMNFNFISLDKKEVFINIVVELAFICITFYHLLKSSYEYISLVVDGNLS